MSEMTPNKPYMIRAVHEWIVDNQCTPYVVVMASYPGVSVPQEFVKDNQITLNISPTAVRDLNLGKTSVEFCARFGGVPTDIVIPVSSIMAVFAKENGQGMGFDVEMPPSPPEGDGLGSSDTNKRPSLKVVK